MSQSPALQATLSQIAKIDRRIDGIRLELYRRVGKFNRLDASAWQLAWDRNPDLCARHEELFRLRGIAQQERDAQAEREYRATQRSARRSRNRADRPLTTNQMVAMFAEVLGARAA